MGMVADYVQTTIRLEAFEEYLPHADSNAVVTVTLVATGVQLAIK